VSGRIQRRSGAKSKGRDGLDVHASNDSSRAWTVGRGQGGFGCPRDTVTALLCAPWAASTANASLGPESPFPSQTSTVIILMPIIGLISPSGLYVSCFLLRRALAGPDSSQRDTKFTFWRARVWDAIQIPISFSCEATSTYLWCL
jgi:hypothetical protein